MYHCLNVLLGNFEILKNYGVLPNAKYFLSLILINIIFVIRIYFSNLLKIFGFTIKVQAMLMRNCLLKQMPCTIKQTMVLYAIDRENYITVYIAHKQNFKTC